MSDFFKNVLLYPRFLAGIMLGVLLFVLKPLAPFMKNPVTAVALIGFFIGGFAFVTLTLRAMLGYPI
ncbi:hypothetical protein C1752_07245 [Acaryochloris thomasi RCC1774]|uniref:DUF751 family protein n=1 Tax=Acaryochloris thomasi RCC1774 TaxID=1764569 RepID=A0A2W1JQY9_9CYAN|nr:DUF751 family protein [Acaryochloris thomasi]PZD71307.1 hypothetical protein C1752_07245 [Acaryochloris thomasi RCC1774]